MFEPLPAARGKVTAGLPGLTPQRRDRRDTIEHTRQVSQDCLTENNEKASQSIGLFLSDIQDVQARIGRALTTKEFLTRLKKLNPNIWWEDCSYDPSKIVLYIDRTSRNPTGGWIVEREYLSGIDRTVLPEFSILDWKERKVPSLRTAGEWTEIKEFSEEKIRGWRTVLARLVRAKLISLGMAERLFGISLGLSSRNWKQLTT